MQMPQVGRPVNLTATGTVCTGGCALLGYFVNSTTAGTLIFRVGANGTVAGTVINGLQTPAIGWNPFPIFASGGLFVTVGGAADVTFSIIEMPC